MSTSLDTRHCSYKTLERNVYIHNYNLSRIPTLDSRRHEYVLSVIDQSDFKFLQ